MRVIIAGSRGITHQPTVDRVVEWAAQQAGIEITEVVSGHCRRGVDKLGENWANEHGVPLTLFAADWDKNPYDAGFVRNCKMRAYADALIAIWDGHSNGTRHMIEQMQTYKKPYFVFDTHLGECYYGNPRKQSQEEGTKVTYGATG